MLLVGRSQVVCFLLFCVATNKNVFTNPVLEPPPARMWGHLCTFFVPFERALSVPPSFMLYAFNWAPVNPPLHVILQVLACSALFSLFFLSLDAFLKHTQGCVWKQNRRLFQACHRDGRNVRSVSTDCPYCSARRAIHFWVPMMRSSVSPC